MTGTELVGLEVQEPQPPRQKRAVTVLTVAAAVAVVATTVGVVASRSEPSTRPPTRVVTIPAIQAVSSALGATVAAQRWDFTFSDSFQPAPGAPAVPEANQSGHGTTNVNPFALVAVANDPTFGQITTMMDGSRVWEFGGGNYGVSGGTAAPGAGNGEPGSAAPAGADIAGFAPLVEGSLGPEDGAVAMLGLGSTTGYLDLVQSSITEAERVGTGVVGGAPVTLYRVGVDPTKLAGAPGITPAEAVAIREALQLLAKDGFQSMTETIGVDASGRIRQSDEVVTFADGAVARLHSTASNFDCAATVVLPGEQPPSAPGPCGTPPITAP